MDTRPASGVGRKINRELVVLLGWGPAVLLQLAHPLVAAGVADHSPFGKGLRAYSARVHRTVGAMLTITFGTDADARDVIARINAIHGRVHGTLGEAAGPFAAGTVYCARDPHLLNWVHTTLLHSLPQAYELFVGPLTREEKDRYCAEAADAGARFGIPDQLLATRFDAVERYMQHMLACGELSVIPRARDLARALLWTPLGPVSPLFRLARLITVAQLPPSIRGQYGFAWTATDEMRFRRITRLVRGLRPWVPAPLREWPAARRRA
jgi:uncharacterized protein (DUF2236 family)